METEEPFVESLGLGVACRTAFEDAGSKVGRGSCMVHGLGPRKQSTQVTADLILSRPEEDAVDVVQSSASVKPSC